MVTLKAHETLSDATESARKRSLFAKIKGRADRCYEVREFCGKFYSAHHVEFGQTGWPVVAVYCDGARDD